MSLDADIIIERRRLKRVASLWRGGAIVALLIMVGISISRQDDVATSLVPHVARIKISGIITEDQEQIKLLDKLAKSDAAKAVIVRINSPGGTTTGGEALYEAIRKIAEKKPTVAVFGTAATSAAYMTGLATDHIVARGNSITGSVGVIFQWADVSDLLSKVGVKMEEVKSGPLKAVPSPFKPTDEKGMQITSELVAESQTWFMSLVTDRRKLTPETLDQVRTGRIFTGRQALANGLVDAIGDENTARTWLANEKKVSKELRAVDWEPEKAGPENLMSVAGRAFASFFKSWLPDSLNFFDENGALAARGLDGLVSVWHLQKAQ
jgi:protease-4